MHKCCRYSEEVAAAHLETDVGEKSTSAATLVKTRVLPREMVRWRGEAEREPGEGWRKWVKLSLEMNLT